MPEEKLDWKQKLFFGAKKLINTIEENAIKAKESEFVTNFKSKIEENKATKVVVKHGRDVGFFIAGKAKQIGGEIDKSIDESEKLSKARETTKVKAAEVTKKTKTGFGKFMVRMGFRKAEPAVNDDI